MLKLFLSCCFLIATFLTVSAQNAGTKILGIWANDSNTAHIEFSQSGNTYQAKIIWMGKPNDDSGNPKKDKNNPDSKLRSRPVLGLSIIMGLKFQNSQWANGTIYSPEKGITASCFIEMPDENTLKMKVTKGIFSSVKTWKRIK